MCSYHSLAAPKGKFICFDSIVVEQRLHKHANIYKRGVASTRTGVHACSIACIQASMLARYHSKARRPRFIVQRRGLEEPRRRRTVRHPSILLNSGNVIPSIPLCVVVRKNKGARLPWRRLVPKREAAMATIQLAFALAVAAATCAPGAHAFQGPLLAVRAAATARPCRQGRVSVSMSGFGGFAKAKKDTFKYTGSQRLSVPTPRRKVPDSVVSDHK